MRETDSALSSAIMALGSKCPCPSDTVLKYSGFNDRSGTHVIIFLQRERGTFEAIVENLGNC